MSDKSSKDSVGTGFKPVPTFHLKIVTPEKNLISEDIRSLIIPAELGYLGVLAHHAPLVASVRPGKITVSGAGGQQEIFQNRQKGFFEFSDNSAVMILSAVEKSL